MKKILIAVLLLASVAGIQAQDTLHTRSLKRNYLPYVWILDTVTYTNQALPTHNVFCVNCTDRFKHLYSKDSITIYGMAVSMHYNRVSSDEVFFSTDSTHSFEYFALYERVADTFYALSDSLKFDMFHTPIEYYMDLDLYHPVSYLGKLKPYPFSEVYFDHPYRVQDTFYIGFTNRSTTDDYIDTVTGQRYHYSYYPFETSSFMLDPLPQEGAYDIISMYSPYFPTYIPNRVRTYGAHYHMMYPILTPPISPQDTTQHSGGGTLGVDNVQTLARFVSLQPNPADSRVQVVSSIGLTHVEVFNPAGVKVMDIPASGLSVTLSTEALPADTYLVRIATPTGTVTKKLIVKHP